MSGRCMRVRASTRAPRSGRQEDARPIPSARWLRPADGARVDGLRSPATCSGDSFFRHEQMSQREAWIWLVAGAAWFPRQRRIETHVVDLNRGQLAVSVRFLAEAWRWEPTKLS